MCRVLGGTYEVIYYKFSPGLLSFALLGIIGSILGFYRNNGKENGNYYLGFRVKGSIFSAKLLNSVGFRV